MYVFKPLKVDGVGDDGDANGGWWFSIYFPVYFMPHVWVC